MRVSTEIRNNPALFNKLMKLAEQDSAKFPIVINPDKPKLYAEGVLQGIDVVFYLMEDLGMSHAAINEMMRLTKAYFDAF